MVIPKKTSLDITSLKPAAKPGLHSSTNSISKEYSQSTVKKRTNFLISSINWDYKKIKNYQLKETKKLLINAYENVPFYRKNFKRINFDPFSFSNLKEIKNKRKGKHYSVFLCGGPGGISTHDPITMSKFAPGGRPEPSFRSRSSCAMRSATESFFLIK